MEGPTIAIQTGPLKHAQCRLQLKLKEEAGEPSFQVRMDRVLSKSYLLEI